MHAIKRVSRRTIFCAQAAEIRMRMMASRPR
jgi:hypothetical protein